MCSRRWNERSRVSLAACFFVISSRRPANRSKTLYPFHLSLFIYSAGYDPILELARASHSPSCAHLKTQDPESGDEEAEDENELDTQVRRAEQDFIDRIVKGEERGHYYLLLGPKGSGKSSMLIQSVGLYMHAQTCSKIADKRKYLQILEVDAEGVAVCEAHEDPEVFRLRLGKALE